MLTAISLGGGVQSTTLALLASEVGGVDCAIFADTGWEHPETYANIERIAAAVDFPVHRVQREGPSLRERVFQGTNNSGTPRNCLLYTSPSPRD